MAVNQMMEGNYSRYLMITNIDGENLKKAEEIFDYYRKQEVICDGRFYDNIWKVSDERSSVLLRFDFSETVFHEKVEPWMGCTASCYQEAAKAYVMFQMGTLSLPSLKEISTSFRQLAEKDAKQAVNMRKSITHIVELLQIIPGYTAERDWVMEELEEAASAMQIRRKKQRKLADFQSYFRFHDVMNEHWFNAGREEKLYYFPIYLWWNLTAVLPLRPTEFLMIPRDCIENNNGYEITIRRTKLKGGNAKLTYTIEGDFNRKKYSLSKQLAEQILWYQSETEAMIPSQIDSLFRREAGSAFKRGKEGTSLESAYGYSNLNSALKVFFHEVIGECQDISEIHLGDTRHIAMMNLIISGGSPVICMELAGHEDIDISSNYYANLSTLVECATYEMYRKTRKGNKVTLKGSTDYSITPIKELTKIEGGWCSSAHRKRLEVDDCIVAVSQDGEIGDCKSCKYYRSELQGVQLDFNDSDSGKRKVNADSWFFLHMLESVRKGIGCGDDIKRAILKLQHSCHHYRECLLELYGKDEGKNGETKENQYG